MMTSCTITRERRDPYSLSAAVRRVYVRQGRRGPFNQVGDITPRGSFGRLSFGTANLLSRRI